MDQPPPVPLRIGAWSVDPAAGLMSRDGETIRVEARTMRLLHCLAAHSDAVVSIDTLLDEVWPEVTVSPDSVYQAVASLRRLLGDNPKAPRYIATVPRQGYRMVATVGPWVDEIVDETAMPSPVPRLTTARFRPVRPWVGGLLVLVLFLAVVAVFGLSGRGAATLPKREMAVAVLPFLDLTEEMGEEYFADGMTEELIDKLSKGHGVRVPPPTASFYFKGRPATVVEIAKALDVGFILDGSVRKSGTMLRVAARLIRADTGFIVWSETYDRRFEDVLAVQDDIAGEVEKALRPWIDGIPSPRAVPPPP